MMELLVKGAKQQCLHAATKHCNITINRLSLINGWWISVNWDLTTDNNNSTWLIPQNSIILNNVTTHCKLHWIRRSWLIFVLILSKNNLINLCTSNENSDSKHSAIDLVVDISLHGHQTLQVFYYRYESNHTQYY